MFLRGNGLETAWIITENPRLRPALCFWRSSSNNTQDMSGCVSFRAISIRKPAETAHVVLAEETTIEDSSTT